MNENTKKLLDATAGIREEYLEEAACARPVRRLWLRVAAVAAVLALVIGGILLYKPAESPEEPVLPLFGIRAYATDGSVAILSAVGDTSKLRMGTSDLFPGKEVYILDVLFTDREGNTLDLSENEFRCFHKGRYMKPGQSDEEISISWVEEEGVSGYRIIGWCEDFDIMEITIRDADGRILHQKALWMDFDGQYNASVSISYSYEPDLTTEELIAKLLDSGQDYSWHTIYASSLRAEYSTLVDYCGGFAELEQREDAAALLLQRWLREMETSEHKFDSVEGSGRIGLILSQDAHWNNLTEEELALIESYGVVRRTWDPNEVGIFPGKQTFSYELTVDGPNTFSDGLTVEYGGREVTGKDEHVLVARVQSGSDTDPPFHGWYLMGWFDRPTKMTLTVTDKDGNVIRREVIVISPLVEGYDIRVLEQFP